MQIETTRTLATKYVGCRKFTLDTNGVGCQRNDLAQSGSSLTLQAKMNERVRDMLLNLCVFNGQNKTCTQRQFQLCLRSVELSKGPTIKTRSCGKSDRQVTRAKYKIVIGLNPQCVLRASPPPLVVCAVPESLPFRFRSAAAVEGRACLSQGQRRHMF